MDAILSYHMNPLTCGIARFNRRLSERLDIPFLNVFSQEALSIKRPLLSIKISEFTEADVVRLNVIADDPDHWPSIRLFFHDYHATAVEVKILRRAEAVYCANEVLFTELRPLHPKVVLAWCPGYLFDTRPFDLSTEISIYTFGMAHKLRSDYFYRLHDMMVKAGKTYTVYVSAGLHEGKSFDDNFMAAYKQLEGCFGEQVRFLGFLSDGALYNYLTTSTFFAAFFQSGLRANNTSVNTAMQCGAVVLTNLDDHSPSELKHLENVIDIRQCGEDLPLDPVILDTVREGGQRFAATMGWEPLVDLFLQNELDMDVIKR